MKTRILFLISILFISYFTAQSTYTSSNFAVSGDVFYLTKASNISLDFTSTGSNYNWDFSTLTGISQNQLIYRNANSTGFVWPWIINPNNANLSSTDGESKTISVNGNNLGITNINEYYKKTSSQLIEVANAYKINYNGTQIPVTNQYLDSDVVYNFPINYGNTNTDSSQSLVDIPNVYHQEKLLTRNNIVDGWGTLTTPFGNFQNVLRMVTTLVETDNTTVVGNVIPTITKTTRELKWFDTPQKIPVLTVYQANTNGNWTTTGVEYLDSQRDFQVTALFAYTPVVPSAGETVYFQNLSTNATQYSWDFGDFSSANNISTEEHPTHIYNSPGTYQVKLTSSNGTFLDEVTIPLIVSVLGIENTQETSNNFVFPNPFTSKINVDQSLKNGKYFLYDSIGKLVSSGKNIEDKDFSELPNGNYIVVFENNNSVKKIKIIKK